MGATFGITISFVLDDLIFHNINQEPDNLLLIISSIILGHLFNFSTNLRHNIIYLMEKNGNHNYFYYWII